MTYREQSPNVERALRPGDEELDWRVYSDLWRDLQLTRGALDVLVFNGKVPWVTGKKLHEFMLSSKHPDIDAARRLGAKIDWSLGIVHEQVYYAVDEFLMEYRAGESVARLRGDDKHNASKLYKATMPLLKNVRLFGGDELEELDAWGRPKRKR